MSKDLLNVNGIMIEINKDIAAETVAIANQVFDSVVMRTPVYTGRMRASWDMRVGGRSKPPVTSGGSAESPLSPPSRPLITLKRPRKIIVENTSEYALLVDQGSPTNEPRNIVAATIASL